MQNLLDDHWIWKNVLLEIFLQLLLLYHREHLISPKNPQHKVDNQRLTKETRILSKIKMRKRQTERGFPCKKTIRSLFKFCND